MTEAFVYVETLGKFFLIAALSKRFRVKRFLQ